MNFERTFDPEAEPEVLLELGACLRYALSAAMRERGLVPRQLCEELGIQRWAWARFIAADRATVKDITRAFDLTGHKLTLEVGDDAIGGSMPVIDAVAQALNNQETLRLMVQS